VTFLIGGRHGGPGQHDATACEQVQLIGTLLFECHLCSPHPPGQGVTHDPGAGRADCVESDQIVAQCA
jgi:hypothetical protein